MRSIKKEELRRAFGGMGFKLAVLTGLAIDFLMGGLYACFGLFLSFFIRNVFVIWSAGLLIQLLINAASDSSQNTMYYSAVHWMRPGMGIVPVVALLCVWNGVSKLLLYELFYEILFRVTRYTALVWVPAGVNAGIGYMMYLAKRHWFYILYEKSFWVPAFWQYLFLSAVCAALYGILYVVICKGDVCK